jgi:hypothetical protein
MRVKKRREEDRPITHMREELSKTKSAGQSANWMGRETDCAMSRETMEREKEPDKEKKKREEERTKDRQNNKKKAGDIEEEQEKHY